MSENAKYSIEGNSEEQKPKKKIKNKRLLVILSVVAVVAVITSVVAGIVLSSPMMLVARGLKNSAKALQKNEIMTVMSKSAETGSVEYSIGLEQILIQQFGMAFDGRINLKVFGRQTDPVISAGLEIEGDTFIDAAIMIGEDGIVVGSDVLLGSELYGIGWDDASDNFASSVFGPDGKYSLGIESIDMIVEYIEATQTMDEEMQVLYAELMEVVLESLKENTEISKENDTLDFNGSSTKVTAVKFLLDDDALRAVVEDVLDYLRDSDEVNDFVEEYSMYLFGNSMNAMVDYYQNAWMYEYYYGIDSFEEYYEYFYGTDVDYIEQFYDALDEIEYGLDELDSSVEVELVCYITKLTTQMVGFEVGMEYDGESMKLEVLAGPKMEKLSEISVSLETDYSEMEISYCIDIDDKSEYAAEFAVRSGGYEAISGTVDWDKKGGDFTVELQTEGTEIALDGTLEVDKNAVVLQLESVSSYGETVELDVTMTVLAEDEAPDMSGDYTDVLEMTADDVDVLFEDASARMVMEYSMLDEEVREILDWILYMM